MTDEQRVHKMLAEAARKDLQEMLNEAVKPIAQLVQRFQNVFNHFAASVARGAAFHDARLARIEAQLGLPPLEFDLTVPDNETESETNE